MLGLDLGPPGYPGSKGDKGDRSEPQKFKKLRRRQHLALQGDGAFDETMGQIQGPPGKHSNYILF